MPIFHLMKVAILLCLYSLCTYFSLKILENIANFFTNILRLFLFVNSLLVRSSSKRPAQVQLNSSVTLWMVMVHSSDLVPVYFMILVAFSGLHLCVYKQKFREIKIATRIMWFILRPFPCLRPNRMNNIDNLHDAHKETIDNDPKLVQLLTIIPNLSLLWLHEKKIVLEKKVFCSENINSLETVLPIPPPVAVIS